MTVNISKRKEAPINVMMLRRKIRPNARGPQVPILLSGRMNVELPCACPKLRLNSGILFTSFKKRHLRQKAQEPIKKVISQYRCSVPDHPKGRRQLRSHYIALWLPPGWFQWTLPWTPPPPLPSWAYWGFVKNCHSTPGCWPCLGCDQK